MKCNSSIAERALTVSSDIKAYELLMQRCASTPPKNILYFIELSGKVDYLPPFFFYPLLFFEQSKPHSLPLRGRVRVCCSGVMIARRELENSTRCASLFFLQWTTDLLHFALYTPHFGLRFCINCTPHSDFIACYL